MSVFAAGVAVLAGAGLGGGSARDRAAAAAPRAVPPRARSGAASDLRARATTAGLLASLSGVPGGIVAERGIALPPDVDDVSRPTSERRASPGGGGDPGPRVALEPLVAEPGRVTARLRGDDPGAPRRLVLWRVQDARAARAADGESRADGSLDFPEVPLAGRGELFVTGTAVSADLAARLPGERIPIPAAIAAADDDPNRSSREQEAQR